MTDQAGKCKGKQLKWEFRARMVMRDRFLSGCDTPSCEADLPAQDWTKQESEDAEGVVTFSYREKPDEPPDVQTIQKQMAIVAWQPGPNRVVQVPSEVCIPSRFCEPTITDFSGQCSTQVCCP